MKDESEKLNLTKVSKGPMILPAMKWDFLGYLPLLRLGITPHPRGALPWQQTALIKQQQQNPKLLFNLFLLQQFWSYFPIVPQERAKKHL